MSLRTNSPIAFIPTRNAEVARDFYTNVLSLAFESDDEFALIFRVGPGTGTMLRVVRAPAYTPPPFTIFGWEVDDIHSTVAELRSKGVTFQRYGFLQQDDHDIWRAPGGSQIAWFQDPDGNTLSLSHHA